MQASKQIQEEVNQLEVSIEPLNIELDRLYLEFGKALPADVETWMKNHVQRQIEQIASSINSGGVEPLRIIKADLNALIQQLPQICETSLGKRDEWPHHKKSNSKSQSLQRINETHAADTYRKSINHLGELLAKHGLLAERPGYTVEWTKLSGNQYRYAINPGFDERRFAMLKEYQNIRHQLDKQVKALEEKRQELAKAKARELWNQA